MPRPAALLAVAGLAAAIASCGKSDLRKTYPVGGTVSLDGKAAPAGIVVQLHPLFTETDRMPIHPRGETDDTGAFKITTYNSDDGAPEGEYVVTVEWPQRVGLSPHFSGDVFGGTFGKPEEHKGKPEFTVAVVKPTGATLDLKLTLTPEQRKKVEAAKKPAPAGGFNTTGQ